MAGWIFYDADCRVCTGGVTRWGGLWTRRGFRWTPLQAPGVAARLRVTETALRQEMKLLLPDGRVLGGAEAWAFLLRAVWWLWPFGALMGVPGLKRLGRAAYRWVARNRHCLGGCCASQTLAKRRRRTLPFFEMP
jgi:predicted DCC family thiol-disulfide oxidoreductase YuxK